MNCSEEICTRLMPSRKSLLPSPIRPLLTLLVLLPGTSTPTPFATMTTTAMTSAAMLIAALTVLYLAVLICSINFLFPVFLFFDLQQKWFCV